MRTLRLNLPLLLVLLGIGCSSTVTQSVDPDVNYALKFSEMPLPPAAVVHSRVERESVRFMGFPLEPQNREWEFELVATPAWIRVLQTDFTPINWADVKLRSDLPAWFAPDPRSFSAFRLKGTSGITAAQLFIETAPEHSDRVRLFLCRH
jgi:hypothetical protein